MLSYPARLMAEGDGMVMLTLPDVPEVVIVAEGEQAALDRAPAVLETILAGYVVESRPIPAPSDVCGAPHVSTERFSVAGIS